jgi:hypothetical protein
VCAQEVLIINVKFPQNDPLYKNMLIYNDYNHVSVDGYHGLEIGLLQTLTFRGHVDMMSVSCELLLC